MARKRVPYEELNALVKEKVAQTYPQLATEVYPTMGIRDPAPTQGIYTLGESIVILLKGSTGDPGQVLAALAHEFGHHEQWLDEQARKVMPPPTELDAYLRGIKWAQQWGILPAYAEDLAFRAITYPDQIPGEVTRVIAHIRSLLGASR